MNRFIIVPLLAILFSCSAPQTAEQYTRRFFSDNSFWNQLVPDDAETDVRSDYWIGLLDRDPSGESFGLNVDSYTIPIYEVNSKEVLFQKVKQRPHFQDSRNISFLCGHETEFDSMGVPIPEDIEPSAGMDLHMAIIDWDANLAWDMFWVQQLEDGSWMSATGMVYPLDGTGVFEKTTFDVKPNESIHGYGPGVAAGTPIIAGVIRYDEVMDGKIRHKLAGALRYIAYQEYVYPAIWTDGNFDGGIPEGATIRLDPGLDLSQFDLTKSEQVVARALQEYGMVIIDFSEGSTIRAEWLGANDEKSWEGILRGWKDPGGIKSIPVKHYHVLQVSNMQKGGDKKKEFFQKRLFFEGDTVRQN